MIYKVAFTGRKANAIGIFYPMFVTIEATGLLEARNLVYTEQWKPKENTDA